MSVRKIVFSVLFLFASLGSFTSAAQVNAGKVNAVHTLQDQYTYVYKWIDGVRWMFIYDVDGALINSYPDPED